MKYQDRGIPADYVCVKCGVVGVKLWRQYQTCADSVELHCCDCAAKDQGKDISDINADGLYTSAVAGDRVDQIGWLVPAIPDEEEQTYWGYTSVPALGIAWWRGLPTRPGDEATGPVGSGMLHRALRENLQVIVELNPITRTICAEVLDLAERLAADDR